MDLIHEQAATRLLMAIGVDPGAAVPPGVTRRELVARVLAEMTKAPQEALRHIARSADTLSPQEFINICADALGVDRHEYAGQCNPNFSLVEAGILLRQVKDVMEMPERPQGPRTKATRYVLRRVGDAIG